MKLKANFAVSVLFQLKQGDVIEVEDLDQARAFLASGDFIETDERPAITVRVGWQPAKALNRQ